MISFVVWSQLFSLKLTHPCRLFLSDHASGEKKNHQIRVRIKIKGNELLSLYPRSRARTHVSINPGGGIRVGVRGQGKRKKNQRRHGKGGGNKETRKKSAKRSQGARGEGGIKGGGEKGHGTEGKGAGEERERREGEG